MNRTFRSLAATTALVSVLALAGAAYAQHRSITQSNAGPFAIDYITEGGRFDRCAATLSPGANMLRIAYNKDLKYSISVPSVPAPTPIKTISLHLGREMQTVAATTDPRRIRAWGTFSPDAITALMDVKGTIAIDLGAKQYRWPIGRTNLENVMITLEDCTHRALGR